MKRLPRDLLINGKLWRVVRKPLAHRKMHGQCVYRKREIQIDSNLPAEERCEAFLHEVLHACLPEHWGKRGETLEETIVTRLTPRLLKTLKGMGWIRG